MGRETSGDFTSGNAMAVTHGAYSILRQLRDGTPFVGLALDLQEAARSELETAGALEAMKQTYSRHAAVTLFLYGILNSKASLDEAGTLRLVDQLRKLNRETFLMLDRLHELGTAASDKAIDYEAILAAKRAQEGENNG